MILVAVVAMLLGIARLRTPRVPSLEEAEDGWTSYVAAPGEPPFATLDSNDHYVNAYFLDAKGNLKEEYVKEERRFRREQEALYRKYSSRKRSSRERPSPTLPTPLHEP
jgi:hypothetical protein